VFAQYTVFCDRREKVQEAFKQAGIPTAVHYPVPLNKQPAYSQLCRNEHGCPEASKTAEKVMSLPMSSDLDLNDQKAIMQIVESW
jgi:UDP-2-acetamido-2-deoxy-ribo-hexuluronate aminotransferase